MKGCDATNGTLNVARPGRPGNAGLVKKDVLAARSSKPTIRMCRSNGMKDVGAGHKKHSVLSSGVEFRCTTTRNTHCGKERCAFHPRRALL